MPLVLRDRVRETTTTTGTGTYTLAGAVTGFQSFSVIGNGNTTFYTVTDGTNWEVGIGTYTSTGTTLARTTILESSNAGSAVNWGAGSKDVFVTYPAERAMYVDGTTITPAISATLPITSGGSGQTTAQAAMNAFAGAVTSGSYLRGNGTNVVMSTIQAGDVPTLNQNTTGTAANVTGTVAVANGGTGQTTYTNGQLLIGNTTGNTLTKATLTAGSGISITNGAGAITIAATGGGTGTVTSVALSGGTTGITVSGSPITTSGTMTLGGTLAVANGGTGATTAATALSNLGAYPSSNPNGYTSNTGTVTSVSGSGTVNGISLSGTVTSSGSLSLSGGISGVSLTSAVSGTLPIGNGGTNSTATPTAGGIAYGTGSAFAFTSAGSAGQVLTSGGTGAPTWSSSSFSFPSGGSAAAPGYAFSGDTDTGIFSPAANFLCISTGGTEAMRINDAQSSFMGRNTQLLTNARLTVDATASSAIIAGVTNSTNLFCINKGTSTWEAIGFRYNTSTQVGLVTCTSTSTTYSTSSDYRLKENVQPMVGALTKLTQLKPVTYDWKNSDLTGEGFIAHELQEVLPYAVVGEKDAVNEDGSVKPQSVDYGMLTPILTAALQEALKKIETLEARIAALEAK